VGCVFSDRPFDHHAAGVLVQTSLPRLITHSGTFHCDDAFAYATLRLALGLSSAATDHTLTRTRDPALIAAADIVWDVGAVHDAARGRFDHHQRGAPTRADDGIPFSAAGLVWQVYGEAAVRALLPPEHENQTIPVAFAIDDDVIRRIDAIDNGVAHPGDTLDLSSLVEDFNPTWDSGHVGDQAAEDAAFIRATDMMQDFLCRRVTRVAAKLGAHRLVAAAYAQSADPLILELEGKMPWQEAVFAHGLPVVYAVYPVPGGNWMVDAMPPKPHSFAQRLPLPVAWAGLQGDSLVAASGIADAVFVHAKQFVGAARSRAGAIDMAKAALALATSEAIAPAVVPSLAAAARPDDAFRVCVHRGTQQIGGTCIELSCNGSRILLDLGLPLDSGDADPRTLLPAISGLREADPSLLALIVSHGHADHWGLAPFTGRRLRIVTGAATRRIMSAAAAFVPHFIELPDDENTRLDLADRKTIHIGPFSITPYLVDHSAFDAYAMLIEANGRRLFYSADIRGHGRKAALFERLINHPPRPVHAMLMEGSSLGRLSPDQAFPTEQEVEAQLEQSFRTPGFIGVCASAQNIDRMVSIYRACKRTDRTLILDLYAAEVLAATGNDCIPKASWDNVAIYVPEYQRRHVKRNKLLDILPVYKPDRIFRDKLAALAPLAVMLFRPAMVADIDLIPQCWNGARIIWSQWDGYLTSPTNAAFLAELASRKVSLEVIHTSGHASIIDLRRLAKAIAPETLIPVHTFAADRFAELFGSHISRRQDGEWWGV
jgi:ribonuclease J